MRLALGFISVAAVSALCLANIGEARAAEPNITGVWVMEPNAAAIGVTTRQQPAPLTAAAAAEQAEVNRINAANKRVTTEGRTKCLPPGMPAMMTTPFGIEILQTKGRITILSEIGIVPRTIHLNQKTHGDSFIPGWTGHSIGHWEGDTLVVDTIGFNGRAQRVSEKMHITERIRLDKGGFLVNEMTLEDPNIYTQPYKTSYRYRRVTEGEGADLIEYVCEVDPANLFAYEAEQKAAGRPSTFDPAWAAQLYKNPAGPVTTGAPK
jgi:hypothetical protein